MPLIHNCALPSTLQLLPQCRAGDLHSLWYEYYFGFCSLKRVSVSPLPVSSSHPSPCDQCKWLHTAFCFLDYGECSSFLCWLIVIWVGVLFASILLPFDLALSKNTTTGAVVNSTNGSMYTRDSLYSWKFGWDQGLHGIVGGLMTYEQKSWFSKGKGLFLTLYGKMLTLWLKIWPTPMRPLKWHIMTWKKWFPKPQTPQFQSPALLAGALGGTVSQ